MAAPPVSLTVEFLADGRCVVSGSTDAFALRDHGARGLQPTDHVAPGGSTAGAPGAQAVQSSEPAGSDFRCPLPYETLGSRAIELRVALPAGVAPADSSFPRLEWHQAGHDWVGTATLPAAPSFVSLGRASAPRAADAFGWNFYGFFVFAAAFIGIYFAWARWIDRRGRAVAG